MTIVYLEPDDEITSAIARLRALTDGEAVLVVPPGSRIATSRINFKLLAREASERKLNVAAVSDDPAVRAVAISAGLPAYDTVGAAEQALVSFREQDRRLAQRIGREPGTESTKEEDEAAAPQPRTPLWSTSRLSDPPSLDTRVMPVVEAPEIEGRAGNVRNPGLAEGRGSVRSTDLHSSDTLVLPAVDRADKRRRRGRRIPVAPLLVLGLIGVLVAGVAYGAYAFLPTATISLVPVTAPLTLETFTVVADPDTAVVDPVAGTLPAQTVSMPLHVNDTFEASGVQVSETKATGVVRFRSENTVNEVNIPLGTSVATVDDVVFVTTEAAVVPTADFSTATPGTVNVPVRAARPGLSGNVDKGTITLAPKSISSQLVSVNNPAPTSGGQRNEAKVVTQADYDGAVAALTERLADALALAIAAPNAIPLGLTPYAQTATHGAPTVEQDSTQLVGTVAPTFDLALDATGQVLAVNEGLIDQIAAARLDAELGPQQQKLGTPTFSHSPGRVMIRTISYAVHATVQTYNAPDQQSLVSQVRGKTVAEAKDILGAYGAVDIVMWPDFIDRLPDQASRISLTVTPPPAGS
ncbi:MAG: baseplate J/gp47 family protein [Candidatus Limnocylindrales bacterium]